MVVKLKTKEFNKNNKNKNTFKVKSNILEVSKQLKESHRTPNINVFCGRWISIDWVGNKFSNNYSRIYVIKSHGSLINKYIYWY